MASEKGIGRIVDSSWHTCWQVSPSLLGHMSHMLCSMEPLEKAALAVAALAHDVGHPGRTNQFFVMCFDPLVSEGAYVWRV